MLEVGVFVGYSAMVWAHAVGPEGKVTGLEFNPDYGKKAEEAFEANGVKNVEIIVGDALESCVSLCPPPPPSCYSQLTNPSLPKLNPSEPYDLIFLDAQKSGYPAYLSNILAQSAPGSANRLLRPGGLIVADNVLRRGLVADESADNPAGEERARAQAQSEYGGDRDLERIREYNSVLAGSERVETFLMPLFDGVSLARLVD